MQSVTGSAHQEPASIKCQNKGEAFWQPNKWMCSKIQFGVWNPSIPTDCMYLELRLTRNRQKETPEIDTSSCCSHALSLSKTLTGPRCFCTAFLVGLGNQPLNLEAIFLPGHYLAEFPTDMKHVQHALLPIVAIPLSPSTSVCWVPSDTDKEKFVRRSKFVPVSGKRLGLIPVRTRPVGLDSYQATHNSHFRLFVQLWGSNDKHSTFTNFVHFTTNPALFPLPPLA